MNFFFFFERVRKLCCQMSHKGRDVEQRIISSPSRGNTSVGVGNESTHVGCQTPTKFPQRETDKINITFMEYSDFFWCFQMFCVAGKPKSSITLLGYQCSTQHVDRIRRLRQGRRLCFNIGGWGGEHYKRGRNLISCV